MGEAVDEHPMVTAESDRCARTSLYVSQSGAYCCLWPNGAARNPGCVAFLDADSYGLLWQRSLSTTQLLLF